MEMMMKRLWIVATAMLALGACNDDASVASRNLIFVKGDNFDAAVDR
jgi:hypothetical protein